MRHVDWRHHSKLPSIVITPPSLTVECFIELDVYIQTSTDIRDKMEDISPCLSGCYNYMFNFEQSGYNLNNKTLYLHGF